MHRGWKFKGTFGAICAAMAGLVAARTYFALIPLGASFLPWTLARVDGQIVTSPDGQRSVQVCFNDAGAMHSGNHWTWVVEDRWWLGRRIVAEGFLDPSVAVGGKPVPLKWGPNNEVRVQFLPGRYRETK